MSKKNDKRRNAFMINDLLKFNIDRGSGADEYPTEMAICEVGERQSPPNGKARQGKPWGCRKDLQHSCKLQRRY